MSLHSGQTGNFLGSRFGTHFLPQRARIAVPSMALGNTLSFQHVVGEAIVVALVEDGVVEGRVDDRVGHREGFEIGHLDPEGAQGLAQAHGAHLRRSTGAGQPQPDTPAASR